MEFTSLIFMFLFFPLFLGIYFLFKKRKTRNIILFLFSLFFYAWGEPIYVFLVLFSIFINYFLTKIMVKNKSKGIFILTLVFDISILIVFKYVPFLIESFNTLTHLSIPIPNIVLPIGISFYTFQMLSYVIDVYRGDVKFQKNIIYLGCYIIAFPQLIAGPIVRYSTIEDELDNRKETKEGFTIGIRRFMVGLAKKVLIANVLGLISTEILSQNPEIFGFFGSWIAMICYSLQILFDFSGYSDMAIGIGKMLGFNYLENFNYPYIAESITDFWRRWHISLSSFFRDYVYIPLGGNRVKTPRFVLNILIVWGLTGLWHGASVNFILWGLYYGIILLIEKIFIGKYIKNMPKILRHIYALLIIIFGWVLFRSTSFGEISSIFKAMFGIYGIGNLNLFHYINAFNISSIIAIILSIIFVTTIGKKLQEKYPVASDALIIVLFIFSICEIIIGSYNPFIYFRF